MNFNIKYRPKKYSEVIGQSKVTTILRNTIIKEKLSSAYLFVGGSGLGKTTTARIFARAIHCLDPKDGNPCDECKSCQKHFEGRYEGLIELDSATYGSIEDARHFKELAKYKVFGSKKPRVLILDESHLLSVQGQNAFLKLLESNIKNLVIIFATTEYNKMITPLVSRCMELFIQKPKTKDVVDHLGYILKNENIEFEENALNLIVDSSDCHLRTSISTLEHLVLSEGKVSKEGAEVFLKLNLKRNYCYILLNLKVDIKTSLKYLDECSLDESSEKIQDGIFNILLKAYQLYLGINLVYDFDDEYKLLSKLSVVYQKGLLKLIESFKSYRCKSKSELLFCLFQAKNNIEYTDTSKKVKVSPKVVEDLKEKDWFKGVQGDMYLKSYKVSDSQSKKKLDDGYKDTLPLEDLEFCQYLKQIETR